MTEAPQRQPDDDPTVPNDDVLQRRLPSAVSSWVAIDQETGTRRPSSSAFKPDTDGVSVYRDQLLRNARLSVMDLVRSPENLVVGVTVADVRSIHLGVRDDIWPPDGIPHMAEPWQAAHALIVGLELLGKNERRRRQQALVRLPSITFTYP